MTDRLVSKTQLAGELFFDGRPGTATAGGEKVSPARAIKWLLVGFEFLSTSRQTGSKSLCYSLHAGSGSTERNVQQAAVIVR